MFGDEIKYKYRLCWWFIIDVSDRQHLAPSVPNTMADKMLHEYSIPIVANMPVGPTVNMGNANFELKTRLITMVQENPFYGLPSEDTNTHL